LETQEHIHRTVGSKYSVTFERGAVKGVIGIKVSAHSDDRVEAFRDAMTMLSDAEARYPIRAAEGK